MFCAVCLGAPAWEEFPGGRSLSLPPPGGKGVGFTLLPPESTGVHFTNVLGDEAIARNRVLENGSGVALGDVDGDGRCDIYLCRIAGTNALYRNLGGWKFEEVAAVSGVALSGQHSTGAVLADIDGDGDLDLLVNAIGGGTRAFRNDSRGRFQEVTDGRLVRRFGSTSLTLGDVDGDGDLDLFVGNYRTDTYRDSPPGLTVDARRVGGRIEVTPADRFFAAGAVGDAAEIIERGERNFFYLNDGRGGFSPVTWTGGSFVDHAGKPLGGPPLGWTLSVVFRDVDADGDPDLYVCNDFFFSPDELWINEGGRHFREIPRHAWRTMSASSMAADFADINRDGVDDFVVVEMLNREHQWRQRHRENLVQPRWGFPVEDPLYRVEVPRNTLFLGRGDGTYAEIAHHAGVEASDWTWGAAFLDVDLDGYEDLLIANGNNHDVQDSDVLRENARLRLPPTPAGRLEGLRRFPRMPTRKLAFRNRRDLTFVEVGVEWGFDTDTAAQGLALGDLDNDGDLDVVLNNLNGAAGLYRNEATAPRIAVRLKGSPPNTRGVGARIRLLGGVVPAQSQEMQAGGRYLSSDEPLRVFAAGTETNDMRIEVAWRSGRRSVVEGVRAGRLYEVDETVASAPVPETGRAVATHFEDVSSRLGHIHVEDSGEDFVRQPLLPRRLSRLGPGLSWADWDGDGREDLVVGGAAGGRLAVMRNLGDGGFADATSVPLARTVARDQASILVEPGLVEKALSILVAAEGENPPGSIGSVISWHRGPGGEPTAGLVAAPGGAMPGPMALGDIDADGDLDLFVGMRGRSGRYPESDSSVLMRRDGEDWVLDVGASEVLEGAGMVSGAVFSDLNGDGFPELILACEWSALRVYENRSGNFFEVTGRLGLSTETGWWNGVAAGDFDGDGRMDLAASNWGSNTKYRCASPEPLHLFAGDIGGNGVPVPIEAFRDRQSGKVVPWVDLDELAQFAPQMRERFPTFRAYSEAGMDDLFGTKLPEMVHLSAAKLESAVFLNRGDRFERRELPFEAQISPVFGLGVGDFDGDGHEDLVLAQNFFGVEPRTSRYDAGRGCWLKGDGRGNFVAVPGQESGIMVYGEGRAVAVADYDGDGRMDVAMSQNGGATRLFRNVKGRAGLRVRLRGPASNPAGMGAVMRVREGSASGPAREIHCGGGYWSQDAAVQVLAVPTGSFSLWIRWPGGRVTETPVAGEPIEVTVDESGRLEVSR